MHEMALTQSIIRIVEESAAAHGAAEVRSIKLTVGELADVVVDSLRFCFEAIAPGTIMEGAELVVDEVEAKAHCAMCGREFHPDPLDFTCPECGNPFTEVVAGKEFAIASIEIEEGASSGRDAANGDVQGADESATEDPAEDDAPGQAAEDDIVTTTGEGPASA